MDASPVSVCSAFSGVAMTRAVTDTLAKLWPCVDDNVSRSQRVWRVRLGEDRGDAANKVVAGYKDFAMLCARLARELAHILLAHHRDLSGRGRRRDEELHLCHIVATARSSTLHVSILSGSLARLARLTLFIAAQWEQPDFSARRIGVSAYPHHLPAVRVAPRGQFSRYFDL